MDKNHAMQLDEVKGKLLSIIADLESIQRILMYMDAEDAEDDCPVLASDLDTIIAQLAAIVNE